MSLNDNETLAEAIVASGAYKTYWDRPKLEWPVSEQGRICPAYCNLRSLIGDVPMRQTIKRSLVESVQHDHEFVRPIDVLCGVMSAGVPWASITSDETGIPLCYARSSIKAHGEKTGVEGKLEPGMSALIIDDVFLTGNTITKTSLQLSAEGVSIGGITVLLRLSDRAASLHSPDGGFGDMKVNALCDYQDLLNASVGVGHMNAEQAERLARYYSNPETQPWD